MDLKRRSPVSLASDEKLWYSRVSYTNQPCLVFVSSPMCMMIDRHGVCDHLNQLYERYEW
jgi:hypothetical protein